MFFDDPGEGNVIWFQAETYVFTGHPDVVAIKRRAARIRHAEFALLKIPGTGPTGAGFDADQGAVGAQLTPFVGAVSDILAGNGRADFLLAEQLEIICCDRARP